MKTYNIFILISFAALFLSVSCSKDNGNYDYRDINILTIVDENDNEIDYQKYDVRLGKQLRLKAKANGTLSKDDQSQISYYWILDDDTLGRQAELLLPTEELGIGNKVGKLVVFDRQSALSYSAHFEVHITAGINRGSFIFTENENQESTLVLRDLNANEDYIYLKEFHGYELGKRPFNLDIGSSATSATNREYKTIIVSSFEGEYPIMVIDLKTFLPVLLYSYEGAMITDEQLLLSSVWNNPRDLGINSINGLVLVNGKVRKMASGVIGDDVYRSDPLDYSFGNKGFSPSLILNGYFMAGFDEKNERIRVFGNKLKGGGLFTENFDELIDPELTKGHKVLAIAENYEQDWKWQVLTQRGEEVYMHNVMMDISQYTLVGANTVANRVVPQMIDAVNFVFSGQYWYFAKGRTIYQCSSRGLDISPYLTLPDDGSGNIVAWNFNMTPAGNFEKIGVATYNPASPQEYKGSYYLYDMINRKFDQKDYNVIDKAVDIEIGL